MKRRWPPNFDDLKNKPQFRLPVILVMLVAVFVLGIWLGGMDKDSDPIPESEPEVFLPSVTPLPSNTSQPPTPTLVPSPTAEPVSSITTESASDPNPYPDGVIVLSLADGYYKHLFAYHPSDLSLTHLTNHPWDDIHPAVSPDGSRLAYSSRRNGFWDIYIFNFEDGSSTRVTDSLAYDGNPTWAPDGQWLGYESYKNGNLDIYIQSLTDLSLPPVQLTSDPAPDFNPAWSPLGDEIAFVSSRSGESEIWTAAIDQLDNRFKNISRSPDSQDSNPAWSPDGSLLGWTSNMNSSQKVVIASIHEPGDFREIIGNGNRLVWSPDGRKILMELAAPNSTSIAAINSTSYQVMIPAIPIETEIFGMDWRSGEFGKLVSPYFLQETVGLTSLRTEDPAKRAIDPVTGRTVLTALDQVNAPHALLSDSVDESFAALRTEIARLSGWDVLGNLENAYLPLTDPSYPGSFDDWLPTGLAFAINPLPLQAGWMAIQKEDIGGEVYWRLYIKTRYQDGSQGMPLEFAAWDLDARSSGNPQAYEEGGAASTVPEGYWVDFSELANRFGWYRLPALNNWQSFYSGARFNQFAYTRGMKWETAMLELYPPELVHQPTRVPTITSTPTSTSVPLNSRTATAQAGGRLLAPTNPNPRPTWTPAPGESFP